MPIRNVKRPTMTSEGEIVGLTDKEKKVLEDAGIGDVPTNFVTTDTFQEITANKLFTNDVTVRGNLVADTIGAYAKTSVNGIAIGQSSNAEDNAISIGKSSHAGWNGIAIGEVAKANYGSKYKPGSLTPSTGVAIATFAEAKPGGVAIGRSAKAKANGIAIGVNASAGTRTAEDSGSATWAVAIGYGATAKDSAFESAAISSDAISTLRWEICFDGMYNKTLNLSDLSHVFFRNSKVNEDATSFSDYTNGKTLQEYFDEKASIINEQTISAAWTFTDGLTTNELVVGSIRLTETSLKELEIQAEKIPTIENNATKNTNDIATLTTKVEENKTSIASKYTKPSTGIPKTDLASDVQATLTSVASKADKSYVDTEIENIELTPGPQGPQGEPGYPALPEDAATKTYILKAVNGVLTWVEETV